MIGTIRPFTVNDRVRIKKIDRWRYRCEITDGSGDVRGFTMTGNVRVRWDCYETTRIVTAAHLERVSSEN